MKVRELDDNTFLLKFSDEEKVKFEEIIKFYFTNKIKKEKLNVNTMEISDEERMVFSEIIDYYCRETDDEEMDIEDNPLTDYCHQLDNGYERYEGNAEWEENKNKGEKQ